MWFFDLSLQQQRHVPTTLVALVLCSFSCSRSHIRVRTVTVIGVNGDDCRYNNNCYIIYATDSGGKKQENKNLSAHYNARATAMKS